MRAPKEKKEKAARSGDLTSWDIAREAGVSQATVSRVLNGYSYVADGTRRRVMEVIDRHGYSPSGVARGLVTRRTRLVGLVIADVTNPFYPELIEEIHARLEVKRLNMLLSNGGGDSDERDVRLLVEHRVEGIIFTSAFIDSQTVARLVGERFPTVLVNREVTNVSCDTVVGNNCDGARVAAEHLLELGHRRIGIICGHSRATTSRERESAFADALESAGAPLDERLRCDAGFDQQRALNAAVDLLLMPDRPTALFALNDVMAFGVMNAARALGLNVPQDLSVIGFDDVRQASWDIVRLTTVRQPLTKMASTAVELLSRRIARPELPPERVVFPSQLMVRETTAPPPRRRRRAAA
jgi:LacI family transcriptional regulator